MNGLRDIVDSSLAHQLRVIDTKAMDYTAEPLAPARWDWSKVRKVLLVRLRSIGDTVLSTPSLYALRRFLPNAQIDILAEDWVAPVLDDHPHVDNVVVLERAGMISRARAARQIRSTGYDVVYNLHGGTTATFLTRATGARHRVGLKSYQYAHLHNHQAPSPLVVWGQQKTHSVEQQLALLGWTGVPVTDRPRTHLAVSRKAAETVNQRLAQAGLDDRNLALIHPATAFATKQWATEKFARVAESLAERGFAPVAVGAPQDREILKSMLEQATVPITSLDLSPPEVHAAIDHGRRTVNFETGLVFPEQRSIALIDAVDVMVETAGN